MEDKPSMVGSLRSLGGSNRGGCGIILAKDGGASASCLMRGGKLDLYKSKAIFTRSLVAPIRPRREITAGINSMIFFKNSKSRDMSIFSLVLNSQCGK